MENAEEILQALDEFSRLKPKEIPAELEEYIGFLSKTGDCVYQWSLVKRLIIQKFHNVITEFFESSPLLEIPPSPNVEPFNYEAMKSSLLERLEMFTNPPFTIQRICELLVSPRNEYNRIDKYMRAVEKNVLVVSTRDNTQTSTSFVDNDKSQQVINGVAENNGTGQDVDVNMLNSELSLENTSSQPTEQLLDIKADELEMDALLIENIPDDKWVKAHNISSDINSVVSVGAEISGAPSGSAQLSTHVDLVSTSHNDSQILLSGVKIESVDSNVSINDPTVESMCVQGNVPAINLSDSICSEPMNIEPVVESTNISGSKIPSEAELSSCNSVEFSDKHESNEALCASMNNVMPEQVGISGGIDSTSIPNSENITCSSQAEMKPIHLLSDESLGDDQALVGISAQSLTCHLSSSCLTSNEANEARATIENDTSQLNQEAHQLQTKRNENENQSIDNSEMEMEMEITNNSDKLINSEAIESQVVNQDEEEKVDSTSETVPNNASVSCNENQLLTSFSPPDSCSVTNSGTSEEESKVLIEEADEAQSTPMNQDNPNDTHSPTIILPQDETSANNEATSTNEQTEKITSSEHVSVSLLEENETSSTTTIDEAPAPSPLVSEPLNEAQSEPSDEMKQEIMEV